MVLWPLLIGSGRHVVKYYAFLHTVITISGNGDILSYEDANLRRKETSVAGMMIGR